jgi:hypothetical protein
MAMEYDRRRPRVPVELAERIDMLRGGVPYERWVRDALEATVRSSTSQQAQRLRPVKAVVADAGLPERPAGSPRSLAFVCPVASCQWPGSGMSTSVCPEHGRDVMKRRS